MFFSVFMLFVTKHQVGAWDAFRLFTMALKNSIDHHPDSRWINIPPTALHGAWDMVTNISPSNLGIAYYPGGTQLVTCLEWVQAVFSQFVLVDTIKGENNCAHGWTYWQKGVNANKLGIWSVCPSVQSADIEWLTGNGYKLSNIQACCLAQLCLAAA